MNAATDIDELRHAATAIRDAVTGTRPANPDILAAAHTTIARCRPDTTGPVRAAIDHLLNEATWHDGPFTLHQAITHLAHVLDIPPHDTSHISEQLVLPLTDP